MFVRHPLAHNRRPRLLITGASTRAAAWSAIRAGFFPVCADRFADEDLRQVAEIHDLQLVEEQILSGHSSFGSAARLCVTDWVTDFSILSEIHENHPRAERSFGQFLGPRFMTHAKGILCLTMILNDHALPALDEKSVPFLRAAHSAGNDLLSVSRVPTDGTWIEKPINGGGGRAVRIWDSDAERNILKEPTYFQQYRAGQPMSAIFVANPQATSPVELIGLTEQIIGDVTAGAPTQFTYCGNIAPVSLPAEATQTIQKIGAVLVEKLGQRGIFGVDFIWDGTTPWVIEVNPRYTAACELLEMALGRALLRDHWQAWLPNEPLPPVTESSPKGRPGAIGKLILYARSHITAPDLSRFLRRRSEWTVPWLADIPRIGTSFLRGEPLCTVFATGADAAECRRKLARRARRVRNWFGDLPDLATERS